MQFLLEIAERELEWRRLGASEPELADVVDRQLLELPRIAVGSSSTKGGRRARSDACCWRTTTIPTSTQLGIRSCASRRTSRAARTNAVRRCWGQPHLDASDPRMAEAYS